MLGIRGVIKDDMMGITSQEPDRAAKQGDRHESKQPNTRWQFLGIAGPASHPRPSLKVASRAGSMIRRRLLGVHGAAACGTVLGAW
jgi:hypothetical protein